MAERKQPLITIGIPTFNRADGYLRQALESAVNQTYPNIEIIVSDNCSSDQTEALVESFSSPRIKYHKHSHNIGASNNFNYCLEQAEGKYFLLLHDDDMIDPDFIDSCIKALGDNVETGVIITGTRKIDSKGKVISETPNRLQNYSTIDFFLGWFSGQVALYLCSTLYNTKRLKELGGFRSKKNLFLDVVATAQLAALHGRIDVHDVKAGFRRHGSNMGGNSALVNAWAEDSLFLLGVMCDLVSKNEEKQRIMQAGKIFLAKKNYRLCSTIKSPLTRLISYRRAYKMFGYYFSPFSFWYHQYVTRYFKSAVNKTKRLVSEW